jgi:hypothetical protein
MSAGPDPHSPTPGWPRLPCDVQVFLRDPDAQGEERQHGTAIGRVSVLLSGIPNHGPQLVGPDR